MVAAFFYNETELWTHFDFDPILSVQLKLLLKKAYIIASSKSQNKKRRCSAPGPTLVKPSQAEPS